MSNTAKLSDLAFPEPPALKADWVRIFMEPLPGSGEKICVGVVLRSGSETLEVPAFQRDTLKCVYGDQGAVIWDATQISLSETAKKLKTGTVSDNIRLPFQHAYVGPASTIRGDSMAQMARHALAMSASFAAHRPPSIEGDESEPVKKSAETARLPRLIRQAVRSRAPQLNDYFNFEFQVKQGARATLIDYASPRLVANFTRLNPAQLGDCVRHAKSKLWNLEAAQNRPDLFKPDTHELLILRPAEDDPMYTDRQIIRVNAAVQELIGEGDDKRLSIYPVVTPPKAATRILEREGIAA